MKHSYNLSKLNGCSLGGTVWNKCLVNKVKDKLKNGTLYIQSGDHCDGTKKDLQIPPERIVGVVTGINVDLENNVIIDFTLNEKGQLYLKDGFTLDPTLSGKMAYDETADIFRSIELHFFSLNPNTITYRRKRVILS